jgi:hypothetical protein
MIWLFGDPGPPGLQPMPWPCPGFSLVIFRAVFLNSCYLNQSMLVHSFSLRSCGLFLDVISGTKGTWQGVATDCWDLPPYTLLCPTDASPLRLPTGLMFVGHHLAPSGTSCRTPMNSSSKNHKHTARGGHGLPHGPPLYFLLKPHGWPQVRLTLGPHIGSMFYDPLLPFLDTPGHTPINSSSVSLICGSFSTSLSHPGNL